VADGGNAAVRQRSRVHLADAVGFSPAAASGKFSSSPKRDHAKAARALQREAMEATTFVRRRANRNAQAGAGAYLRLQTSSVGFVIRIQPSVPAKIEVKSRLARRFRPLAVYVSRMRRTPRQNRLVLVLPGPDDGFRQMRSASPKPIAVFTPRNFAS